VLCVGLTVITFRVSESKSKKKLKRNSYFDSVMFSTVVQFLAQHVARYATILLDENYWYINFPTAFVINCLRVCKYVVVKQRRIRWMKHEVLS
jgi:hypothetical protein